MWSPNCLLVIFNLSPPNSQLSPTCGLPLVTSSQMSSHCVPIVFHLSPSCLPVVSQMFPKCGLQIDSRNCLSHFPAVFQNWSSNCLQVSSTCHPVVSQLPFRCCLRLVMFVLQMWSPNRLQLFHLFHSCLPDVVQMSPNCVPYLSRLSIDWGNPHGCWVAKLGRVKEVTAPSRATALILLHLSDLIRPTKTQTLHPSDTHTHTHIATIEPIAAWCCWLWKIGTPEC